MDVHEELDVMNIFFDLDGTLIDSKERLHKLFLHLVAESSFSFEEYWQLKQDKINHKELLSHHYNYPPEKFVEFEKAWMDLIEMEEWLNYDQPFPGVTAFLTDLKRKHNIFVVTARQSTASAIKQIEGYGWKNVFEKILVTNQTTEKYDLIKNSVDVSPADWFVGDTGKDIQTGKLLGIKTAAVLSGFLSEKRLKEYEPTVIVDSVTHLNFSL